MNSSSLNAYGRGRLVLSLLSIGAVFVAEVLAFVVALLLNIPDDSMWFSILPEFGGALVALLCLAGLCGAKALKPQLRDVGFTFRFGWWCMVVAVGLMAFELYDYLAAGTQVQPGWLQRFGEAGLLCLLIGIMEELVFRGLLFQGLLAALGGTHRGVVLSVAITSLAFGLAHVDFSTDFSSMLSAIQAVLKVVQIGIYSVMLCVIVLRTHGLAGVSVFHGFDDFLVFLPSVVLFGESTEVDYVVEGDEAYYSIAFYLIIILLYLPLLIKSLRDLHRCQDVWRGLYVEHYLESERLRSEERQRYGLADTPVAAPAIPGDGRPPVPLGLGDSAVHRHHDGLGNVNA